MSKQSSTPSNIRNRSPWRVQVRSQPSLDRQFRYGSKPDAEAYLQSILDQGRHAKLAQLETAFELRVRRQGIKTQYLTFDTLKEAEQARLKLQSDLSVSIVRDYAIAAHTTLRELMERYRDDVAPQHKGAQIEIGRLNRIMRKEAFVDKKLAALCTEDLQDFIEDRLTEVKPATVDRDLDQISQVINYADDVWKIAAVESPFKGLRRPKYFNERTRRLSKDEEKKLLEAARQHENPYIEPAIILALETAARRGELLALTARDMDFERRQIHVRDSKNGRSRDVPMTTRARSVIRALISEGNDRLLNLSANALKLAFFRRVVPAAKLEDFHFHDLRHEAISRLAESSNFELLELQAISGHRDGRMLQRYVHLCSGNLAEKMDSVSGDYETYIHRGRKRRRGGKASGAAAGRIDAQTPDSPSHVTSAVAQMISEQEAQQRSNVLAFRRRRVA
ncbi:site-specific integrase [Alcaligenaceae bacterium]|nr:site-specific integrase [Alcaligenaceae bacterium]